MSITYDISGTITLEAVGIPLENYHTPALVSYNTSGWGSTRKRTYTDSSGVAADFPSSTGPEQLWAAAKFAQTPKPETIAILRGALPATKKFTLVPTVRDSYEYLMPVGGDGVTTTEVSFTSGVGATLAQVCDGIMDALNAVTGKNFTATGGVTEVVVTGDAAGEWFWLEILDPADWTCVEDHADPGIATDLAAIKVADDDWYALETVYNSEAYAKAAAAWAVSNGKIYAFETNETEAVLEVADGTQGLLDDVSALAYQGVLGVHHPRPAEMLTSGALGRWLAQAPGASVLFGKTISGATPSTYPNNSTYRTNLVARKASFYERSGGAGRFKSGAVGGTYLWLDVKRNVDFMENLIQTRIADALYGAEIVPFTDEGVGIIETALRGAIDELVETYKIFRSGTTSVFVPKVEDTLAADRAARILRGMKWAGTLAGAIQGVRYTGSLSF